MSLITAQSPDTANATSLVTPRNVRSPVDREAVPAAGGHALGFEWDEGMLLGVEKVGRLQVPVAPFIARQDAVDVNRSVHNGGLGIGRVEIHGASDLAELALDVGDVHVADLELHRRVCWIDPITAHVSVARVQRTADLQAARAGIPPGVKVTGTASLAAEARKNAP
jgi:hypothetical protein